MNLRVGLVVLCSVSVAASDRGRCKGDVLSEGGFGFELLLNKLEAIEHKIQKMEKEPYERQPTLHKLDRVLERVLQNQYSQPFSTSCKDVPSTVSGTYLIRANSDSVPFKVYCEQQAFGGGWIVIQHRYDGSFDSYRNWREFRDGFGDLEKLFWLGLEKVHQITKDRRHELMVELKDFGGADAYARYDAFEIGSEGEQYVLKHLGSYNGTAGDSMRFSKGMKFTTKDRDNDKDNTKQCAHFHDGAWWHRNCTNANLNGRYRNSVDRKSMHWWDFNTKWQGLSFSRMMIRELE